MIMLNGFAGLGGNRKSLPDDISVIAVEKDPKIAKVYQDQYPQDEVMVEDVAEYLLNNFHKFDLIWLSPPCQSHSRMIRSGRNRKPRYPDLSLYEFILFLANNCKDGQKYVVENVIPYYEPLIQPTARIGRHLFWSNFNINPTQEPEKPKNFINSTNQAGAEKLKEWLGIHYEGNIYYEGNHCPAQVLRNCVHPDIGRHVFDCAVGHVEQNQGDLFEHQN